MAAHDGGPVGFVLPDELDALSHALHNGSKPSALAEILELSARLHATRALLETGYVDADYRNEYVHFYAQTFRGLPDRCRRLHLFRDVDSGDQIYLGFVVLRPIATRPVGRTFLAPPAELTAHVSCLTPTNAHAYGQRLGISAFPFMEQDALLGVCAHASVWMVSLYHHLAHQTPRRYLSDVVAAVGGARDARRPVPSDGLTDEQVGTALETLGLDAISYAVGDPPLGESVEAIVCRYLNSRLPVILTTPGHVTVLIGYGRDAAGRLFFVRSDEGTGPYVTFHIDRDPLGRWDLLMVPRPGRIYLPGETAELAAKRIFEDFLDHEAHARLGRRLKRPLRLRSYVRRAGEYLHGAPQRGAPSPNRDQPTSKWVWVVELQDPALAKAGPACVLGEVVLDATSDRFDPNPLFGHLPGRAYRWDGRDRRALVSEIEPYSPYATGTALHDAPTAIAIPREPWTIRAGMSRTRQRMSARRGRRR